MEQKSRRHRASRALAEWQQRGPRKPWLKWTAVAFCCSVADAAVRRLAVRGLSAGMAAWIENVREARRSAHFTRSGLAKMFDRRLRFGMRALMEYAELRSEGFRKLRLGGSAFMNGLMRAFWNSCK